MPRTPQVHVVPLLVAALSLTGCASDIMQGYTGRTPRDVMVRYGPPHHVFDLPDGRRAFQWRQTSQSTPAPARQRRLALGHGSGASRRR